MNQSVIIGVCIPFLGTTFGAALVFLARKRVNQRMEKMMMGFVSGIMMAASVWSLLMPAIEMAEGRRMIAWIPAAVGFLGGIIVLLLLEDTGEGLSERCRRIECSDAGWKKTMMLIFAVTLHNIPEGMAVGVTLSGAMQQDANLSIMAAFIFTIGIAIQNVPEGAIVSLPLFREGNDKIKSFLVGVLSGIVEPVSAIVTILLTGMLVSFLPYFLAFAAGAMIYVVVEELIPQAQSEEYPRAGVVGLAMGFVFMMVLDVTFG